MGSTLKLDSELDRLVQISGTMPRLIAIPSGCAFHPRCPYANDRCRDERPEFLPADAAMGGSRAECGLHRDHSVSIFSYLRAPP
jgi:peptide/nickel transport system ATP-binding protein